MFTDDSPPIEDASQPYDSKPTGNILKRFFRIRFKPESLGIEDSIWFFFSGHGLRHEGEDYLMPCDADSDSEGIEETAILLKEVTNKLRESGAGDVVIIYDACRNKSKAKGQGFGAVKTKGVITLASCSANQKSYEIDAPEIQQGSFTYALLEALENTQLGRENHATFDRLYQRLRYRVPELNRQYNQPVSQKPSGYVEPDEKRYCILLPQQATIQDIEIYKKQALNAELNNNLREAKRLLIRLWEICPGDPEIRQYYDRVILKQAQQPKPKTNELPVPRIRKNSEKPVYEGKELYYLSNLFIMWTVSGCLREDSEQLNYLLSAFNCLMKALAIQNPSEMMMSWIIEAKQQTSEALDMSITEFDYLEFNVSNVYELIEIEESYYRLYKHANKRREPSDIAKVRLALMDSVGEERQQELVDIWNN